MSRSETALRWLTRVYLLVFFTYLLFPLGYMSLLAFNDSRIPTHRNFTFTLRWFGEAWHDERLWDGLQTSFLIAIVVVILSILLGLGGALLLTRLQVRAKGLIYAVLVSPILAPGIVLGISTFIFWNQQLGFRASWWTAAFAQTSFIAAYCMLIFIARLQRFDTTLEEAGLGVRPHLDGSGWGEDAGNDDAVLPDAHDRGQTEALALVGLGFDDLWHRSRQPIQVVILVRDHRWGRRRRRS